MVGRIGRAHGVRGDVAVDIRTDAPEVRFADGVSLRTDPPDQGPLVVASVHAHSGRTLVHFVNIDDRTAAEALAGTLLVVDRAESGPAGKDAWWDHELEGLRAYGPDGAELGVLTEVVHAPAQDLLALRLNDGREVLLPFVAAFVPAVQVAAGRVDVVLPAGLLDL